MHSLLAAVKTFGFMVITYYAIIFFRYHGFKSLCFFSTFFSYCIFLIFLVIFLKYGAVRHFANADMKAFVPFFSNKGTAILVPCVPILIYCLKMKIFNKLYTSGALVSCYATIFLSESRASLVLIIIATLGTTFFLAKNIKTIFIYICSCSILVACIFVIANYWGLSHEIIERVVSRSSNSALLSNEQIEEGMQDYERIIMFILAKNLTEKYPILGVGYQNFGFFMEKDYGTYVVSHNFIITTWTETGIVGFSFFAWLLFECGKNVLKQRCRFSQNKKMGAFYGVLFICLILVVIHGMVRPQLNNPMFYLTIAACLCRCKMFVPYSKTIWCNVSNNRNISISPIS